MTGAGYGKPFPRAEGNCCGLCKGEAEWRIGSRFLLDDQRFYALAYAPLVRVLNANRSRLSGVPSISLAAEIDGTFYDYPDSAQRLAHRLEQELALPRSAYRLTFNPNGDMNAVNDPRPLYQQRGVDGCAVLREVLMESVDAVGPSIYDAYGHIAPAIAGLTGDLPAPSLSGTRDLFLGRWASTLQGFCPGLGRDVELRFRDHFYSGEFSLQGRRSPYYRQFFTEALAAVGEGTRLTLWTTGQVQFDPFADPLTAAAVQDFLRCR